MASCIPDIVSLGLCDDEISLSGFTLMQAAGMSPLNGDRIATEQYNNGKQMFEVKKSVAENMVRNDFIGVLQQNRIVSTITKREYNTCYFNTSSETGTYSGYRGLVVASRGASQLGTLRKFYIDKIQCYPLQSGECTIRIRDFDNGIPVNTNINVNLVANQLNTFDDTVGFERYHCINDRVLVEIDQTTISFADTVITCKDGCDNTGKNPCGSAEGYNGTGISRKNGFGLNVVFSCNCDYDELICKFSRTFTGELIWLKWQALVYEEMYKTNRFNTWTTYNRDEIMKVILPDLNNKYNMKFNEMIAGGMLEMLKQYNDNDCLNCRGVQQITNI